MRKKQKKLDDIWRYIGTDIIRIESFMDVIAAYSPQKKVLEVGMGRGHFLRQYAQYDPDAVYFGLERKPDRIHTAIMQKHAYELSNLFFVSNTFENLFVYLSPDIFEEIWITFPDPWPKARHHKRRLTSQQHLKNYRRLLSPDGRVCCKTDNMQLFEDTKALIEADPDITLRWESHDLPAGSTPISFPTEYEAQFREQNLPIYSLQWSYRD